MATPGNATGFFFLFNTYYTVTVLLAQEVTATARATGITPVGLGPHEVVASYSGNSSYGSSVSGTTVVIEQAPPTTTTQLALTSGGAPVTVVTTGSVVTLTATVNSGVTAVTTGLVNFCDATAAYCTDIHLLGTAQLTSGGKAVLEFVPGIGSHTYKAVYAGTYTDGTSASSTAALTVTGKYPTTTSIAREALRAITR